VIFGFSHGYENAAKNLHNYSPLMKTEPVTTPKPQAAKILDGIARGETAVLESRRYNQTEAKEKMSKWLK